MSTVRAGRAVPDDRVLWRWAWRALRDRWPLVALAAAIVVVAIVITPDPDTGLPLDPASTGPDGTRALVEVLDRLGLDVAVVAPDDIGEADVVVLLRDQLGGDARDALHRQVTDGTRLVVADPSSELAPDVAGPLGLRDRVLQPDCDQPALADVGRIRPGGGVAFAVPDGAVGCFPAGDGSWLVVEPRGRGQIVSVGGPQLAVNSELGRADHAVLLGQLLSPDGARRVAVVRPTLGGGAGEPTTGLIDLLPGWVGVAALQALLAFVLLVVLRARRLGAPLIDTSPVRLASAELTAAVGDLLARSDTRSAALGRIADDTRRRVARRLGLPSTSTTEVVAAAVADRTELSAAAVVAVLAPPPPADDAALLRAEAALHALTDTVRTTLSDPVEPADVS